MPPSPKTRRKLTEARRAASTFNNLLDQGERALQFVEAAQRVDPKQMLGQVLQGIGRAIADGPRRPRKRG